MNNQQALETMEKPKYPMMLPERGLTPFERTVPFADAYKLVSAIGVGLMILLFAAAAVTAQGTQALMQEPVTITSSYTMPEFVSMSSDSLLDVYMKQALEASPALKASFEDWMAARTVGDQTDRLPDPEVMFGYYLNPAAYEGVFSQASLGVMQMFPWPGSRAEARQYANTLAQMRWEALENERINIQQQVMTSWFELIALSRQDGYLSEHLEWVRRLQSLTRTRFENGYASRADILRLEIERMEIEADIRNAASALEGAKARFNALLQRPAGAEIQLPEGRVDIQFDFTGVQADSLQWQDHPQVRQAELQRVAAGVAERQAHLAGYPMIGVGLEVMGSNYLMGMGNNRIPVVASVRMQIPVWRKPVRARVEQARAESRSAEYRREVVLQDLRTDLAALEARYRDADERVHLYQIRLLPRSRELTDLVLLDYSGGRTQLDDVISSRRLSVNYAISLENALRDRNIAVAELLTLFESSTDLENNDL
ncbi:MAG: TolC family protein [Bacteroidetes bacterium]|nr:TolC family protein [Bacteroidota bacterium]